MPQLVSILGESPAFYLPRPPFVWENGTIAKEQLKSFWLSLDCGSLRLPSSSEQVHPKCLITSMSVSTNVGSYPPPRAGYSILTGPTPNDTCEYDTISNVSFWQRLRLSTVGSVRPVSNSPPPDALNIYLTHGVQAEGYDIPSKSEDWDLTQQNWNDVQTDRELQQALRGGVDEDGYYWEGQRDNSTLAETFGRQFWNTNLKFSIPWVFFATSAFVNINQQLRNQYGELKDAIESLVFDTFSIDDFFPSKSQYFSLFNSLTGLSGIFLILGGFVPVAGPFIAAAGTIASGVGTFLQNSAASSSDDPLEAQKKFSQKVLTFYRASLSAMDDLVTKLFIGEPIPGPGPGSFTLLDMMKDGAWVNPNTLTNVSNLKDKIRREILARSIDSLWKSRTKEQTIKMWVLFTDLSNDPDLKECGENSTFSTGLPDSKYCADGGVYYTYNFWEQKSGGGGVGWPYGADKLKSSAGIELKVNSKAWNWDYTGEKNAIRESVHIHPPCLCGTKGLETYDWAKAAGLSGFETFWHRCNSALRDKSLDFEWPDDVTFVDYPADTGNKHFTVKKP
ncbi:MAG: hypothetical protein Q9226_006998 [Calogaya cf. arnoldii]